MKKIVIAILAAVILMAGTSFAQMPYFQDFEGYAQTDGQLAADGWLIFGNVFNPSGGYLYGYGVFPAPNNIGNWCDVVLNEGGPDQEMQQLVMYSDYANGDHANGNLIECNLFQEQVLPVGASGVWTFNFDAKRGNIGGNSTAFGFIKVLNPAAGWATSVFNTVETTNTPVDWTPYSISVDVTGLDGQILQIGFMSVATNYEPAGVFYDNVAFSPDGTVATSEASLDDVKAMFR
jgi:hypothetical protein